MDGDDWLISSMKRYDQLFMYDVAYPIQGFDWTIDHTGLWVYSTFENGRTELNLLQLPEKIVSQSLTGHRDFKILCGALVPMNVSCVKVINDSLVAVGDTHKNCVHFWTRDTESEDLLVEKTSFTIPIPTNNSSNVGVSDIITSSDQNTFVTVQGRAGLLTIFDTASGHVKWQRHMADTSVINGACFTNDDPNNLFVCCGNNGDLIMCDTRQPSSPVTPIVTTMCSPVPLVTFSSNNINSFLTFSDKLKLYDMRSLSEPFAVVSMKHKEGTDTPLCVKFGLVNCNRISLSGISNRGVEIYDAKEWSGYINDPSAIFIHDGHEAEENGVMVLTHSWHHTTDRMLISAANDGSLHAWQYNKESIVM